MRKSFWVLLAVSQFFAAVPAGLCETPPETAATDPRDVVRPEFPFRVDVAEPPAVKAADEIALSIRVVNTAPTDQPLQLFGSGFSWISDNPGVTVRQGSPQDGPVGPPLVETRVPPHGAYEEQVYVSAPKRGDVTFRLAFIPLNAPEAVWTKPITLHVE